MIVILAVANEAANGVNFSLVPHCNPCEYNPHYTWVFDLQAFIRFQWFHGEILVTHLAFEINIRGQSGIVGAMGNLGGVVYALVFRFQPVPVGKAFWIAGIIAMVC